MTNSASLLAAICATAQGKGFEGIEVAILRDDEARVVRVGTCRDGYDHELEAAEWIASGLTATILLAHSLWKALAGEEMVCGWCGAPADGPDDCCAVAATVYGMSFEEAHIPAFAFHVRECAARETDEERIEYCARAVQAKEKERPE